MTKPWTLVWQQWWDRSERFRSLATVAGALIVLAVFGGAISLWLRLRDARVAAEARQTALQEAARDIDDEVGPFVTALGAIVTESDPGCVLAGRLEVPLDDLGDALNHLAWKWKSGGTDLRRSVEWMFTGAARIAGAAGLKVVTEVATLRADGALPEGALQQIQPCIREAVTNVIKPAQASNVFLRASMTNPSTLHHDVEDDGQGMSTASGGPGRDGLQNLASRMRQIGGLREMAAEPGRGVLVFFAIPLGTAKARA